MNPKPNIQNLLEKESFSHDELVTLLSVDKAEQELIFEKASQVKQNTVGNKVYLRGLVEYSNICTKNCLYCGVRSGNKNIRRYRLTENEVLEAAQFVLDHHFGSMVIQGGELSSTQNTRRIGQLVTKIKQLSQGKIGITLSMGEQSRETYRYWFECGAHRYLLRIETSNPDLYKKIHPMDTFHSFEKRLQALDDLRNEGFQVGTGVMIGLPFQTNDDLANDLEFFKNFDIDMIGMGPYIEHKNTPLYQYKDLLLPPLDRFYLSLKMLALLRITMPDINIAATTAMETIHPRGKILALQTGANVMMPNITPLKYRDDYLLYEGKPHINEESQLILDHLIQDISAIHCEIGWDNWGDSRHFFYRHYENKEIDPNP
ncbi:MAG TPA: [FeFe] hydrogenase H-cluster radical SAM maturase HydE [Bacteroidales bacterium]|jgi:biotin synthase|nr:[FeFe] hydrogenase H-cluster radical SAM maturase HydE [Bacteroidales bacterium]